MNVFATVKTSINTREAAERYGVEVNRHGKALCPFHNDRNPSLFVDDDYYHCFACGEHGYSASIVSVGCFTNRRIFNETTVQYSTVYETEP